MKLTVLGSSGTYAAADNPCSGYLVQAGGLKVLVDAGPGTIGELQRHGRLEDLDAVLLSHSHPDHWAEIPVLRNALRYVLGCSGLPLYATAETLDMISSVCHDRIDPTFGATRIQDGSDVSIGPLTVRCSRTDHPPETLAFCIDDGVNRVAYSADSGPGWSFEEFGGPVDLAICEATFREGSDQVLDAGREGRVHMTAAEAGEMARRSGAFALVITHLLPGADRSGAATEAASAYGAGVSVAAPGMSLEL
ncbi:MAG: MBL fold metallo-hydrolase [Microthrixaceae bacterium]